MLNHGLLLVFIEVILHELFRFLSVFPALVISILQIASVTLLTLFSSTDVWLLNSSITLYTSSTLLLPLFFANAVHFSESHMNKCDFKASAELFSCLISTVFLQISKVIEQ